MSLPLLILLALPVAAPARSLRARDVGNAIGDLLDDGGFAVDLDRGNALGDLHDDGGFAVDLDPADWPQCLANRSTPWLLLAGDSNWRNTYMAITKRMEVNMRVKTLAVSCGGYSNSTCDDQWQDRDRIYEIAGKPFRISFRFMRCPERQVQDLVDSWKTIRHCACSEQPKLFSHSAWERPHTVIFGHGLWGLVSQASCQAMISTCSKGMTLPRHRYMAEVLQKAKASIPDLKWATNPHIKSHPKMTPEMIGKDRDCQKEAALETGVNVFDVWNNTESNGVAFGSETYHWDESVQAHIEARIFRKICFPHGSQEPLKQDKSY